MHIATATGLLNHNIQAMLLLGVVSCTAHIWFSQQALEKISARAGDSKTTKYVDSFGSPTAPSLQYIANILVA
uniref:Uncharacterized protein n=1 Tax=Aspergillus fumigatus TaxID=746128 RepID=Q6MY47_ASPFM|nr:hypothetical protein AfA10A1.070 [Aspergillus fumigatus]